MGLNGFYWVLMGFNGFEWVFTEFFFGLVGFSWPLGGLSMLTFSHAIIIPLRFDELRSKSFFFSWPRKSWFASVRSGPVVVLITAFVFCSVWSTESLQGPFLEAKKKSFILFFFVCSFEEMVSLSSF